jgi:hypothetical protein
MNFFNRLQGVFFNPKETLKAISEKPVWMDTMIVLLVLIMIFSVLIMPYAQKDQIQNLKNNVELQERLGEEAYQRQLDFLENPPKWFFIVFSIGAPLFMTLIGFFLPPLILLAFGRMFSTEGNYKQTLSVYLHASIVNNIFGNAVRLILILTRKSVVQTTTSLALFFPKMEVTSTSFTVLSQIDFFQIWFFGILAFGISSVFKIDIKKSLFLSYGFWFLKSLLYIGLGALGNRFGG